jgi:hypothetical protein
MHRLQQPRPPLRLLPAPTIPGLSTAWPSRWPLSLPSSWSLTLSNLHCHAAAQTALADTKAAIAQAICCKLGRQFSLELAWSHLLTVTGSNIGVANRWSISTKARRGVYIAQVHAHHWNTSNGSQVLGSISYADMGEEGSKKEGKYPRCSLLWGLGRAGPHRQVFVMMQPACSFNAAARCWAASSVH